jgi:acyl-CoA dehydrogenase
LEHADTYPEALIEQMKDLGIFGLAIPEEYGGTPVSTPCYVLITEELARGWMSLAGAMGGHTVVSKLLLHFGTDEQKNRYLPKMATGEIRSTMALTEPGGGSDLQAIRTKAVPDGDDYLVTGSKTFITNGGLADLLILAVKTDTSQGAAGISLLVCELTGDPPGFRRGRLLDKIGLHANDTAELFFDEFRVPRANLLGAEGGGFFQMMAQLPQERLVIGVTAVAAMQRAVELAVAYAKERTAFGKPLIAHQNTRMVLAECATRTRASRVFLDDCITRHVRGDLDVPTAAMAKLWLTEGQCEVVDRCLQIFGGYGYTTEYPIARMYADARVQKIYGGTNEIMKELIARVL